MGHGRRAPVVGTGEVTLRRIWVICALCGLLLATVAWARTLVSSGTASGSHSASPAREARASGYAVLFGSGTRATRRGSPPPGAGAGPVSAGGGSGLQSEAYWLGWEPQAVS